MEDEDLICQIIEEVSEKGQPINKPKGFKRAYPKLYEVIIKTALEYSKRK